MGIEGTAGGGEGAADGRACGRGQLLVAEVSQALAQLVRRPTPTVADDPHVVGDHRVGVAKALRCVPSTR